MDSVATFVWIAPEPPDVEQGRSIASWSGAHGLRLHTPEPGEARPLPYDPAVAEAVETDLDRTRDAIAARDTEGADRALSAADALLRAHADLPQAAWLMAEVERAWASRWRRLPPGDPDAAERAWERAEALDGGRAAGLGEEGSPAHPPAATIELEVVPLDVGAWIDGRRIEPGSVPLRAGLHAVVATWRDAPVSAAWIDVAPGASTLLLRPPVAPPCSAPDVGRAQPLPGGSVDARYVRCPTWIAASAGTEPGTIRVAQCASDRCGPTLDWRSPPSWSWTPPAERGRGRGWPAWATWTLVGAGAAIAASAVIVATGVAGTGPSETRFVSGGIKSQ